MPREYFLVVNFWLDFDVTKVGTGKEHKLSSIFARVHVFDTKVVPLYYMPIGFQQSVGFLGLPSVIAIKSCSG